MTEDREWADVGEHVRAARLAMGLSQNELGDRVGLDRTMIAKVEAGSRRVDALELARLSAVLKVPMGHFLQPSPTVLSRRAAVMAEESDSDVARESQRLEQALAAWLRDVRQLVDLGLLHPQPPLAYPARVEAPPAARQAALWVRDQLGLGIMPIDSLFVLCERSGQYVSVMDLPGDGASAIDGDLAVAVVSGRGEPGRRRATAAHELGHAVLGDAYSSDLGVHASRADREAAVDVFAAELLLPAQVLVAEGREVGGLSRDRLLHLAAVYRTSWSLALRQAEHAGALEPGARRRWSQSSPTRAEFLEALGWVPQVDLDSARVPPGYAHAVMQAWRRSLVTSTRAVELFRGQISETDLPPRDDADVEP